MGEVFEDENCASKCVNVWFHVYYSTEVRWNKYSIAIGSIADVRKNPILTCLCPMT